MAGARNRPPDVSSASSGSTNQIQFWKWSHSCHQAIECKETCDHRAQNLEKAFQAGSADGITWYGQPLSAGFAPLSSVLSAVSTASAVLTSSKKPEPPPEPRQRFAPWSDSVTSALHSPLKIYQ